MKRITRETAAKGFAVMVMLCAALGMTGCGVLRNYAHERKCINDAWEASGVSAFLKDPNHYLAATNDVEKTMSMLVRGAEAANDGVRVCDDIFSKPAWRVRDEDIEFARCNRWRYETELCLLLQAHKIVRHSKQKRLGDPDGSLRKEFATDDMSEIDARLEEERITTNDWILQNPLPLMALCDQAAKE